MKLRLHEGRCSPMIILLCNLLRWNLSKCSQFVKFVLPIIKKLEKREVTKAVSLLFAILCYLSLSQIWSYEFFLSTHTRKGTNMFNGPTNLRKFHLWKRDKSCPRDPYFVGRKTSWNGKELRQDLHLSMCKLSNRSPFGNLSYCIFFRFFRRIESLCSHPDLARSKKLYGASWNVKIKKSRNWCRHVRSSIFTKHERITENSFSLLTTKLS